MSSRILLMSSERSGSNLLRSMLSAHSDVHGPPAVHLTHGFAHIHQLGDLRRDDAFLQLAADVLKVVGTHPVGWEDVGFTPEALAEAAPHRSLWGLADALYMERARLCGATRWLCKDNDLFDHAFAISEALDDVGVVYLVRDGRDVVCSMLDAPLHPKHPYVAGVLWARQQRTALRVHQQLLVDGRSVLVRYEDLVSKPEKELRRICDRMDLTFEAGMLDAHRRGENRRMSQASGYWKNLGNAVSKNSVSRYERDLDAASLTIVESVMRDVLLGLGYAPSTQEVPAPRGLRAALYRNISRWRSRWVPRGGKSHIVEREKVIAAQRRRSVVPWIV